MKKTEEEAFLDTYNKYSDPIFRFVLFKLNDREKAKDFTQETFMKTWLYISENGPIKNIKAFLYRVAGNMVIDEYRKKGRGEIQSLDNLLEDGFEPSIDDKERMIDEIDGSQVVALIKKLPKAYAEILSMRYVKGLGIAEISKAIGKSANIVSVRLNRGIKRLKELVKK